MAVVAVSKAALPRKSQEVWPLLQQLTGATCIKQTHLKMWYTVGREGFIR